MRRSAQYRPLARLWKVNSYGELERFRPADAGVGAGITHHSYAALASFSIANNLSGASGKDPFLMPGGSPAASTSSFSIGSVRRYISVLWMLAWPSHRDTLRMSPVASRVWTAQEWRLCRARHRRHTCACHLLRSGVDINTIRDWLGHVGRNHQYLRRGRSQSEGRGDEIHLPRRCRSRTAMEGTRRSARTAEGNLKGKSYVRQFGQRPRVDSELGVLPNIVSCTTYGL